MWRTPPTHTLSDPASPSRLWAGLCSRLREFSCRNKTKSLHPCDRPAPASDSIGCFVLRFRRRRRLQRLRQLRWRPAPQLGGNKRIRCAQAMGRHLREAGSINRSLTVLGKVRGGRGREPSVKRLGTEVRGERKGVERETTGDGSAGREEGSRA